MDNEEVLPSTEKETLVSDFRGALFALMRLEARLRNIEDSKGIIQGAL